MLASLLGLLIFTRADVETTLLRAPGSMFQKMPDGRYSNLYTVRLVNKTSRDLPVELRLESPPGNIEVMGQGGTVAVAQKLMQNSILVELDPFDMKSGTTPVIIGVYSEGKKLQTLKTSFVGPRN